MNEQPPPELLEQFAIARDPGDDPATMLANAKEWTYLVRYGRQPSIRFTVTFDGSEPPATFTVTESIDVKVESGRTPVIDQPAETRDLVIAGLDAFVATAATTSASNGTYDNSFSGKVAPEIDIARTIPAASLDAIAQQLFGDSPVAIDVAIAYRRDGATMPVLRAPNLVLDAAGIAEVTAAVGRWAAETAPNRDGAEFSVALTITPNIRFRDITVPFGAIVPEMTPTTERL